MKTNNYLSYAALLFAAIFWGSSFTAMKVALEIFRHNEYFVIFSRVWISAIIGLIAFKKYRFEYRKNDWMLLLALGIAEPGIYFYFETQALIYTSASQAAIIASLLPIVIMLPAVFYFKEKISIISFSSIILAIAATILLTLNSTETTSSPRPVLGNILEFCAVIASVGMMVSVRKLGNRYNVIFLTTVQSLIGCVIFTSHLLITKNFPSDVPIKGLLVLLYLGAIVSFIAYSLFNYAIAHLGLLTTTFGANLIPVFALGFSWLFLKETLSVTELVLVAIIIISITLATIYRTPAKTLKEISQAEKHVPHG